MNRLLRRPDVWIALLVCIASTVVSAIAYQEISQTDSSYESVIDSIPSGRVLYNLVSDEGCIGRVTSSLEFSDEQYLLKVDANLRLQVGAEQMNPSLEFRASFNSIGQLGGTFGTLRAPDVWIRFGSREIDPIQASIRAVIRQQTNSYATLLPGPALLKLNRDKTYRIEYLHFGKVLATYRQGVSQSNFPSFLPRLEPANSDTECDGKAMAAMNLSLLIPILANSPMAGLIPG